jgi:hypothetical protein
VATYYLKNHSEDYDLLESCFVALAAAVKNITEVVYGNRQQQKVHEELETVPDGTWLTYEREKRLAVHEVLRKMALHLFVDVGVKRRKVEGIEVSHVIGPSVRTN